MKQNSEPKARKAWTTPECVDCDRNAGDVAALAGAVGFDGGAFPSSFATS